MKDLVLSLLSRGYSQVVQPDDGGQYGRLEVYFEPEDYFNWKSQPPLLRLTSSGRLLGGVDPAPPKTYSTRRGPLILYSEDLALSSCQPHKVNRKGRAFRTSREDVEVQLHTLQDLTEAILAYGKKQAKVTCHTSVTQPLLPASKRTTPRLYSYQRPAEEEDYVTQLTGEDREEHVSSTDGVNCVYPRSGQMRYQPRFLCLPQPLRPPPGPLPPVAQSLAPRHSEDRPHLAPGDPVAPKTPKTKDPEDQMINKDIKTSFRTAMAARRIPMSPIPEAETRAQEKLTGWPEDQTVTEHLTGYPKDISGQWKQSAIETGGEESGHFLRTAYMDSSFGCSHLSRVTNYRRRMEGACQQGPEEQTATNIHVKKTIAPPNSGIIFHLPSINQASPLDSDTKNQSVKAGSNTRENHKDSVPRLPDIHLANNNTEIPGPKPPERTIVRKVLLLQLEKDGLHSHFEDEEERDDGLQEKKEMRQDILCGGMEKKGGAMRGGENEPVDHGCQLKATGQYRLIWIDPEENKEHQTTPGPLPPFLGRRGPGKQSSMALYRQEPCNPSDQSEPQTGIIRGSLPLELRECEKGRALGSLIMGPAGEIIRLSLWDALTETGDHPVLDDATREHVLRVVTSEGVLEQPWTVLLEEQITHPDRMDASEPGAKPDHKKQATSNQEDKGAAEHTKARKNVQRGADGKRTGDVQAAAPEQRLGKLSHSTEKQPNTKGKEVEIKRRGRAQGLQPEDGATPGSPKLKSTSTGSPQETALSSPAAGEEHFHKGKPESQTNTNKDNIKTQSKKAGGGDDAESTQKRKARKVGEVDQHVREAAEKKHAQKKTVQTNMDSESEDSVYTADTNPSSIQRRKKATEEGKTPKVPTTESTKPQNNAKKVKKKSKGRAAFVVGKPRQSHEAHQKEADRPEMHERTAFNTEEEPEKAIHDHCCSAPGHNVDSDLVSVYQEDHTAASSRIHSSSAVSSRTHSSAGVSFRTRSSNAFFSRTHSPAGVFSRMQSPAGVSSRTRGCDAVSYRTHRSDMDSSRTHSSTAFPTARDSSRRTSIAAEAEACNTAPLSFAHLPSHCAAHQPASNPTKSESGVDAKGSDEAINLRDSKAAALAEKAESRRLEVERKRKEKEEERRRQQEREEREEREQREQREDREERMRLELEDERRQRAEQARLRKLTEEDERQRQEEKEIERLKKEKAEVERERRRQEEKRRLMERFQRERQEAEMRRAAELRRRQLEEEAQREQERRMLEEMDESERLEYLRRKQEEEEERRKAAEERRKAEEEAAMLADGEARLLAQLTAKQRAALERQLMFQRSLFVEAGGLEQTQDISRPWVFSYFSLLELLGLAEPPEDLVNDEL